MAKVYGSSTLLLAALRLAEEDVTDGRAGVAGRRVLRLAGLTRVAELLLSRLAEAIVVVAAVHAPLGTTVSTRHRITSFCCRTISNLLIKYIIPPKYEVFKYLYHY